MKYTSYEPMNCSLAQALTVLGERWTLLILRDAFMGAKRFGQFEKSLGIAKNILSTRLRSLVTEGVLEKREAADGAYAEYHLTEAGLDLLPVLLTMTQWGDQHRPHPDGLRIEFVDRQNGERIQTLRPHSADGAPLQAHEVKAVPGPGTRSRNHTEARSEAKPAS